MYITHHQNKQKQITYILWSDKRKIIYINQDRDRIYSYMNILQEKRKNPRDFRNSWLYMILKYNIYFI